jgi:hypothetical protein
MEERMSEQVSKPTVKFKIKKSLLDRVLEGGPARDNLTNAELQECLTYCLLIIHGDLDNWGDNVIRDVAGDDKPEEDIVLDLTQPDFKFEKLKKVTMHPDKRRGKYSVDTGPMGGTVEYKFFINPPEMNRTIDFEEYPGPGTKRELEAVLRFYRYLT